MAAYHAGLRVFRWNLTLPARFARLAQAEDFVPRTSLPLNRRYDPRLIKLVHHRAEILHDKMERGWSVFPEVFEAIVTDIVVKATAITKRSANQILRNKKKTDVQKVPKLLE